MKRRPPVLKLSQAVTSFLQYKTAAGLSRRTLEVYEQHMKRWTEYAKDPPVTQTQTADVRASHGTHQLDSRSARSTGCYR